MLAIQFGGQRAILKATETARTRRAREQGISYGVQLRVCRPYRARTKGKVERFNGYLKRSFLVPLAATLRAGGLTLDVATANPEVLRWLANAREHGTTGIATCEAG